MKRGVKNRVSWVWRFWLVWASFCCTKSKQHSFYLLVNKVTNTLIYTAGWTSSLKNIGLYYSEWVFCVRRNALHSENDLWNRRLTKRKLKMKSKISWPLLSFTKIIISSAQSSWGPWETSSVTFDNTQLFIFESEQLRQTTNGMKERRNPCCLQPESEGLTF